MEIFKVASFLSLLFFRVSFADENSEKFYKFLQERKPLVIPLDLKPALQGIDPLKYIPDVKLNFNKLKTPKTARGNFNVGDVLLAGFSSGIGRIEIKFPIVGITTNIGLDFDDVTVSSNYFAKMVILDMLRTNEDRGDMKFVLKQLKFSCTLVIDIMGGFEVPVKVAVNDFQLKGNTEMILTGYLGNNDLSQMVADEIADIVSLILNNDMLKNLAKIYLEPVLNIVTFLFNLSPKTIMSLFG